jgi:hypothetical protein
MKGSSSSIYFLKTSEISILTPVVNSENETDTILPLLTTNLDSTSFQGTPHLNRSLKPITKLTGKFNITSSTLLIKEKNESIVQPHSSEPAIFSTVIPSRYSNGNFFISSFKNENQKQSTISINDASSIVIIPTLSSRDICTKITLTTTISFPHSPSYKPKHSTIYSLSSVEGQFERITTWKILESSSGYSITSSSAANTQEPVITSTIYKINLQTLRTHTSIYTNIYSNNFSISIINTTHLSSTNLLGITNQSSVTFSQTKSEVSNQTMFSKYFNSKSILQHSILLDTSKLSINYEYRSQLHHSNREDAQNKTLAISSILPQRYSTILSTQNPAIMTGSMSYVTVLGSSQIENQSRQIETTTTKGMIINH